MMNYFKDLPQKPTPGARLKDALALGLLAFIALTCAVAVWSMFKPANLTYDGLPWEIAGDVHVFKGGETVPLQVIRCNNTNKPLLYTVTRAVKNLDTKVTTVLQSTMVSADPGCSVTISRLHVLPKDIQPGTYIITGIGTIPDIMNDKMVSFESKPFTVE